METYQQRVVEEKEQLDRRLAALSAFIRDSSVFLKLGDAECGLLLRQESVMQQYSRILLDRIARWMPKKVDGK